MTRILIADDHSLIREGLKQVLSLQPDLQIMEAATGQEVLAKMQKTDVHCVILDISMPGRSGLEILKEIKSNYPKVSVIMLSIYPEEQYALRCLKAGASGYLTKDIATEKIIDALNTVLRGKKYISGSIAEKLIQELGDEQHDKMPHEKLSDREYEVLLKMGAGKTVTEIGEELFISAKTVSTYRARILEKMYMKNNAELIHYVIENKLPV